MEPAAEGETVEEVLEAAAEFERAAVWLEERGHLELAGLIREASARLRKASGVPRFRH